jgi:hypothetical protein
MEPKHTSLLHNLITMYLFINIFIFYRLLKDEIYSIKEFSKFYIFLFMLYFFPSSYL